MTIEQLKVLITADVSGLVKEVKKATGSFDGLEASVVGSSKRINSAIGSISSSVKRLGSLTALAYFGKKAIGLASDLQEVQNVVEVAFGSATAEINEFAEKAMEAFGLTQYQAKKTASTIMAMSNGMGIGAEAGKTMAINLTKLSGDMASFYNVSQDVAETALHSIFTGETETLKRFGIVMTEANLKAFALSQGITTLYNDMSQAQKVALRYNYVMQATAQAQGDFARTSMNWANQIRILTGQWATLVSTIGKGLIAVLTPVLGLLNRILASAIGLVNTFAKIFGGSGIASVGTTLSSAGAGASELDEGLKNSAGSAKKLKKYLAGFDELNVINNNDGSGSGGIGDIGGIGGGDIDVPDYYGEITETANMGKGFNELLDTLNSNILKYYDAITAFGTTLGEKFNKAFQSIDWDLLGETVGNGINLVYETANNFMEAVEWYKLGASFATGINSAFETIKWDEIGKFTANKINALFLTLLGVVENLNFELIGKSLKTKIDNIAQNLGWMTIGKAIGEGINGIVDAVNAFLEGGTIENLGYTISNMINMTVGHIDAKEMGEAINNLTIQMLKMFELIDWTIVGKRLRELIFSIDIVGIISAWVSANVDNVGSIISGFFNIPEGAGNAISSILVPLTALGVAIAKIASSTAVFAFIQNMAVAFAKIKPHVEGLSVALTGCKNTMIALPPTTATVGTTFAGMFAQLQAGVPKMTVFKEGIKALWAILKVNPIAKVVAVVLLLVSAFVSAYNSSAQFRADIDKLWENHLKPLWENLTELVGAVVELLATIVGAFADLLNYVIGTFVGGFGNGLVALYQYVEPIIIGIADLLSGIITAMTGIVEFATGIFTGDLTKAMEGIKKMFEGIWDGIVAVVKGCINIIIGCINGMIQGIVNGVNTVKRAINSIRITIPGWVPKYGGKSIGFNLAMTQAPKIPLLANGGVITEPTVAMMGEYAGAYNNPEIVTPQSLLQSTIESSNKGIVDALIQQTKQLLIALEDVNMEVSIGDETIAQSAKRGNQSYYKRTGKPLFV